MEEKTMAPNFAKIAMGLVRDFFWDYYCYIDREEYALDKILVDNKIPVKFMPTEFRKPDSSFVFCMVRCGKKYRNQMIEEIFPSLHKQNTLLGGKAYLDFCDEVARVVKNHLNYTVGTVGE